MVIIRRRIIYRNRRIGIFFCRINCNYEPYNSVCIHAFFVNVVGRRRVLNITIIVPKVVFQLFAASVSFFFRSNISNRNEIFTSSVVLALSRDFCQFSPRLSFFFYYSCECRSQTICTLFEQVHITRKFSFGRVCIIKKIKKLRRPELNDELLKGWRIFQRAIHEKKYSLLSSRLFMPMQNVLFGKTQRDKVSQRRTRTNKRNDLEGRQLQNAPSWRLAKSHFLKRINHGVQYLAKKYEIVNLTKQYYRPIARILHNIIMYFGCKRSPVMYFALQTLSIHVI